MKAQRVHVMPPGLTRYSETKNSRWKASTLTLDCLRNVTTLNGTSNITTDFTVKWAERTASLLTKEQQHYDNDIEPWKAKDFQSHERSDWSFLKAKRSVPLQHGLKLSLRPEHGCPGHVDKQESDDENTSEDCAQTPVVL
jgi:hypothetical protein